MASDGYLAAVLADGARPFPYRAGVLRLLGLPTDDDDGAAGELIFPGHPPAGVVPTLHGPGPAGPPRAPGATSATPRRSSSDSSLAPVATGRAGSAAPEPWTPEPTGPRARARVAGGGSSRDARADAGPSDAPAARGGPGAPGAPGAPGGPGGRAAAAAPATRGATPLRPHLGSRPGPVRPDAGADRDGAGEVRIGGERRRRRAGSDDGSLRAASLRRNARRRVCAARRRRRRRPGIARPPPARRAAATVSHAVAPRVAA